MDNFIGCLKLSVLSEFLALAFTRFWRLRPLSQTTFNTEIVIAMVVSFAVSGKSFPVSTKDGLAESDERHFLLRAPIPISVFIPHLLL